MNKVPRVRDADDSVAKGLQDLDECHPSTRRQRRVRTGEGRRSSLNSSVGCIRGHGKMLELVVQVRDNAGRWKE